MEQGKNRRKRKSRKVENESEATAASSHLIVWNGNPQSEDSTTLENRMNGMSPLWREFYLKVVEKLKNK